MGSTSQGSRFSGGVAVLFGTQVVGAGVGIINGILIARLLGPTLKGDYYILILLPATAMVAVQLGLPQAFGYFAARDKLRSIVIRSMTLTVALSALGFLGVILLLPVLAPAVLHGVAVPLGLFALLALPLALNAAFTTAIVMGRQAVRWYAVVNIVYPLATTGLLIIVLGGIGPTVAGAIAVYLMGTAVQSVGFTLGAIRVSRSVPSSERVSYPELLRYGLRYYPGSLTSFFSYRVDAYLIAWLIVDPSAPLGYYSLAVGLAEMVFFFPRAVYTLFFPHVAGSPRVEADRQVSLVARVTLLATGVVAIALVPAAAILISVILPAYGPSFTPLVILLPGVVALSVSNVVGSYLVGIGRPGIFSLVSVVSLTVNIVANLLLIPSLGIVGAAASSLLSYSLNALVLTIIAGHLAGAPLLSFWLPRWSDLRFVAATALELFGRLRAPRRIATDDPST